jgi:hypothetical protein
MATKDLFSNKDSFISRKQMRGNFKSDPTFQKKVLGNSRAAEILNRPGVQKKVHDLFLEKARDGKVDVQDMNEIARRLEQGKVEGISSTKGRLVAKEFLSDNLRKYASEKSSQGKMPPGSQNTSDEKPKKLSPAFFASYKTKTGSNTANAEDKNRHTSFFNAMRSVRRNKQI